MPGSTEYKHVFFKPWIGDRYGASSDFGLPLLILGESCYEWEPQTPLTPTMTIERVREDAATYPFWIKVASAFLGKLPSPSEAVEFWRSVAFYNFVQESVGFGWKNRPTGNMWRSAAPAFLEVLAIHKPRCIVALGETLWWRMPDGNEGPKLLTNGRPTMTTSRLYPIGAGEFALAARIFHPSSRTGWTFEEWHPGVAEAIRIAKGLQS
jgi:hypothetical protein